MSSIFARMRSRTSLAVTLVCLIALAVAGCGGDDDNPTAPT